MTKLFKNTILLLFLAGQSLAQTASLKPNNHTIQVIKKDILSLDKYKYMYFMKNPYQLINYWGDEFLPINKYTNDELQFQRKLNAGEKNEFVKTKYVEETYTDNNYILPIEERNIDNEPITPFTWKWVTFEIFHEDGGSDVIKVCRPNWWIKKYGATDLGNKVFLEMPENAILGNAVVTSIIPNQLDTRIEQFKRDGEYTYRPVIGTFKHQNGETWDFFFSEGESIGATANHPFFSLDRNNYIPVGELKIGEKVKNSINKEVVLIKKVKRPKLEPVHNLEVYRDHNFMVGEQGILVHNNCNLAVLSDSYFKGSGKLDELFQSLSTEMKAVFKSDFDKLSLSEMKVFQDNGLFDIWQNVFYSSKMDILLTVKRIKSRGLLFNGKFDIINNPGCIGHLDADVEKLLLEDGWVRVSGVTTPTHTSFQKLTGTQSPTGFRYFYGLDWNPNGVEHAISQSSPVKYWKLTKNSFGNSSALYRSTIDPTFTNFSSPNFPPVFKSGVKVN